MNTIWIYWALENTDNPGWYQAKRNADGEYVFTKRWIKNGTKSTRTDSGDEGIEHAKDVHKLAKINHPDDARKTGDYVTTSPTTLWKRKRAAPAPAKKPVAKKPKKKNILLMMQSRYDPNGAFDEGDEGFMQILKQFNDFDFRYVKVGSVADIQKETDKIREEGRQIGHLIFMAHGSKNSMALSNNNRIVLGQRSFDDFVHAFDGLLADKSSVLLHSCLVGGGDADRNIAMAIARVHPGITIWGATESIRRGDLLVTHVTPDQASSSYLGNRSISRPTRRPRSRT
jgi:hypothetical protein